MRTHRGATSSGGQPPASQDRELAGRQYSSQTVLSSAGLLSEYNRAGGLQAADVWVAQRLGDTLGEANELARLGMAIAVAAARDGATCADLTYWAGKPVDAEASEQQTTPVLCWPELDTWMEAIAGSKFVTTKALRLEDQLLYVDRYWRDEKLVCEAIISRLAQPEPQVDMARVQAGLERVFPAATFAEQRAAAAAAIRQWFTIITGGPGTGKTTAVAGMMAVLAQEFHRRHGRPPLMALAAPTGKAATRLQEAVDAALAHFPADDQARLQQLQASTIHRLLGKKPDTWTRFKHNRTRHLPHDVIVIDEASMVSLTMMARLLEAMRPDARLIMVGDPDQLASVEAGNVLADLVNAFTGQPDSPVAGLHTAHRYGKNIGALAQAVRVGDATAALEVLTAGGEQVELIPADNPTAMAALQAELADVAVQQRHASQHGDQAAALRLLNSHRLLCAHRHGLHGVSGWNRIVENGAATATGVRYYQPWYPGRPVLVQTNDAVLGVSNGDIGITVRVDEQLRVVIDGENPVLVPPARLPDVETVHAMTIHKSQGSQAHTVTVIVPPVDSALLTRELFYTAITRAQTKVRVVGTPAMVTAALARQVQRASGLQARLQRALQA